MAGSRRTNTSSRVKNSPSEPNRPSRSQACGAALPQRAVPDLCELTLVANALELSPDRPDLHAPIARITEIADRCGYQNVTHFIRQFRSRTGRSPNQFRFG